MIRLVLLLLALTSGMATTPSRAADPRAEGATGLVVTYHTRPADRPALRRIMQHEGLDQLAALKSKAGLAEAHLLWGRYADSAGFDMMLLLRFETPAALAEWAAVERESPGALPAEAAKLVTAIETAPADLVRSNRAAASGKAPPSVFLVVPYDYLVGLGEYLAYLDGYTLPQTNGWIDEGVLNGYGVYIARYGASRPWSALLVLDYRGDEGLAKREATVAKVRARLAADPSWKQLSDTKQKIRDERAPVVADELLR